MSHTSRKQSTPMWGTIIAKHARKGADLPFTERRRVRTARKRTVAAVVHHEDGIPYWRCHDLIAEALIVRERVTGHIVAATYQARMSGLASGARR